MCYKIVFNLIKVRFDDFFYPSLTAALRAAQACLPVFNLLRGRF